MQVFSTLFGSNDNALVCAPTGSGKTICAEFAILQMIAMVDAKQKEAESDDLVVVPPLKAVYVASMELIVKQTMAAWEPRFGGGGIGLKVVQLTGEQQVRLALRRTLSCIEHFLNVAAVLLVFTCVKPTCITSAQVHVMPAPHSAFKCPGVRHQTRRGRCCR